LTIHHPIEGIAVADEQKFEIELGKIFKSKPVRRALEALLLQARDMQNDESTAGEENFREIAEEKSEDKRATALA